jgi:two-component system NtrC family sensor kinase
MRPAKLRAFLLLDALAIAAVSAAFLLISGLPLLARAELSPRTYLFLVVAAAGLGAGAGALLLVRIVARPIERLLAAAAALGANTGADRLPVLGEEGGPALARAALAFERLASELGEERARLAAKVDELTRANVALADARESLLRSEKLATVGRLAAGLAHEVGNPLGAISGYVELARARIPRDPDPELVDALARISTAAARIDRTVRDLLDFARPAQIAIAPIDLAAAVDATLRLARVQSRFRRVDVDIDLAPGLPRVVADEHHVAQVLLNVLLNAGDAMRGEGRVRLSARADAARVWLDVADEGPGIAHEDLPRLFDPFFTTKEPGDGSGLGLAICHRIMDSFGGEISAANAPGGGAVFRLGFRAVR